MDKLTEAWGALNELGKAFDAIPKPKWEAIAKDCLHLNYDDKALLAFYLLQRVRVQDRKKVIDTILAEMPKHCEVCGVPLGEKELRIEHDHFHYTCLEHREFATYYDLSKVKKDLGYIY